MENCRWCGMSVSADDVVCPRCGMRLRRETSTCRRCKKEIRSGLVICPNCGEDLFRTRIPWKLFGGLGGLIGAVVVGYLVLTFLPLPFHLPFVAAAPTASPTEVILPPTPTHTATPRPPTATPTRTATPTQVITETATVDASPTRTVTITATSVVTPTSTTEVTGTPTVSPGATQTPGLKYRAPKLVEPEDQSDWAPDHPLVFAGDGERIELRWEAVGTLARDEYYAVELRYVAANGQPDMKGDWIKETTWRVPQDLYGKLGGDRTVKWTVTVVVGTPGSGEGTAVSPASETWMFRWG